MDTVTTQKHWLSTAVEVRIVNQQFYTHPSTCLVLPSSPLRSPAPHSAPQLPTLLPSRVCAVQQRRKVHHLCTKPQADNHENSVPPMHQERTCLVLYHNHSGTSDGTWHHSRDMDGSLRINREKSLLLPLSSPSDVIFGLLRVFWTSQ